MGLACHRRADAPNHWVARQRRSLDSAKQLWATVPEAYRGIAVIYFVIAASFIMLFRIVQQAVADCSHLVSGQFPDKWIDGTNCADEPQIQVYTYNDHF